MASYINSSDEEDLHTDKLSSTQFNTTYIELPEIELSDDEVGDDEDFTLLQRQRQIIQQHSSSDFKELTENLVNRTYLLTYSQANMELFPSFLGNSRIQFGEACVAAFGGVDAVDFYCVALEEHRDGGKHFHVSILLSKPKRWLGAQKHLSDLGMKVHFGTSGSMYAGAYYYTTKTDKDYHHGNASKQHPRRDVIGANSKAAVANQAYRQNAARKRDSLSASAAGSAAANVGKKVKKEKPKRFSKLNAVDIIMSQQLSNDDQLMLYAKHRRENVGDERLLEYLVKVGEKGRAELLRDARKLETCAESVALANTQRLDIIHAVLETGVCTCDTKGFWLVLAYDICEKNGIEREVMGRAFYNAIVKGRKKHNNIIILGESNCAKTFLVAPLRRLFKRCFSSPAASGFAWDKVETAQVILLNDYRWAPLDKAGNITWSAFLLLLEGDDVKLPAPMNHKSEHYEISHKNDVAVFCTSGSMITYWKKDVDEAQTKRHTTENKMMLERWHKPFCLTYEFSEDQKAECDPCEWCFCKFITC